VCLARLLAIGPAGGASSDDRFAVREGQPRWYIVLLSAVEHDA
jgi:hypothetical protein